jgi:hypothetical protein
MFVLKRAGRTGLIAAVLATAMLFALATTALAVPNEQTLDLAGLHAKLDAAPDGIVTGYMKTVVKGSTIVNLPVNVLAITGAETPSSSLILFEATGTLINSYGGIVEGMSGSPIYVNDGGVDKIVGAVSYGDYFTIGGTGLATPIDAMSNIEKRYAPETLVLDSPIIAGSRVYNSVVLSADPQNHAVEAQAGALVANPLASLVVGGASSHSKVFAALQKRLASAGMKVTARNSFAASSPSVGDTSFETSLVAGASVAALVSRGDLWLGSVGTVTYGTDDTVLAYGHPANYDGATSMYMTNAWIDGIWPDQMAPYKIGRPTAVRGEITQDRGAGIMGRLNQFPAETAITAHVVNTDNGEETRTAVYVPRKLLNTTQTYSDVVPMGLYPAASRLLDTYMSGGSAVTTTTVEVSDGTNNYTIVIPNVVDDSADIQDAIINDSWNAISSVQAVLDSGIDQLDISSVNLEARISAHRKNAQIVGLDVPGGVKTGLNYANVSVLAFGQAATQTVVVPFTVPAGVNTRGLLTASASDSYGMYSDYFDYSDSYFSSRESLADIVTDLNSAQPNNVISLTFEPTRVYNEEDIISDTPPAPPKTIESSAATAWAVTGQAEAGTPIIQARLMNSVVNYGGYTMLSGYIEGPDAVGKVSVYGHRIGTPGETFLGYAKVLYLANGPGPLFSFPVDDVQRNTVLRIHVDGSDSWTAANTSVYLKARAKVSGSASKKSINAGSKVTLTSKVWPQATVGGTVTFQQWNASQKRWVSIKGVSLVNSRGVVKASTSWKPKHGVHKVRAYYRGGKTNVASASGSFTVTVR